MWPFTLIVWRLAFSAFEIVRGGDKMSNETYKDPFYNYILFNLFKF